MGILRYMQTLRAPLLVLGTILIGSLAGCDSGGGNEAPKQVAQARPAADEGAFRNLGKRTSFDYGDVGASTAPRD